MPPASGNDGEIRALGRGLEVLALFSKDRAELSLTEIAALSGLPLPTAQRVVRTLDNRRFLHRRGDRGPYRLGPAILSLIAPLFSSFAVADVARPFLEELAERTEEASNLAILYEGDALYLASSSAQRMLTTSVVPGTRLPAHCTALGKALLAQLDDEAAREAVGEEPYERFTPRSSVRWSDLAAELETIRERGHSLSVGEFEQGLAACAVPLGVAAWGAPSAVNVSAPVSRSTDERTRTILLPALREAAEAIRATFNALDVRSTTPPPA